VRPGDARRKPGPFRLLVAEPARDPERRLGGERTEEALEVVRISRHVRSCLPPPHHAIIGEMQNEAGTAVLVGIAKELAVDPAILVKEDIEALAGIATTIIGAQLPTA